MNTVLFFLLVLLFVLVITRTLRIFKSIRWRLQVWYGLILLGVLVALGAMAYRLQSNQLMQQVDRELHLRVNVLASSLRHRPPPRQPDMDFGGPPPPRDFPGDNPFQRDVQPSEFHLRPEDTHFFDPADPHQFFFSIQSLKESKIIASSTNQPNFNVVQRIRGEFAGQLNQIADADNLGPNFHQPPVVNYENYLEAANILPSGEMVVVGCSIAPEMRILNKTALELAGMGVIILFFGLAGGWWISSRAIRPVETISATAFKISAGDLSQRINIAETESELGQLAAVLNSTFTRLESAFEQQKQFASDAAHELRTPVAVILTQTQTALNRERDAKEYKETVEACQRAAQRMRKLIGSLLELARLDAGQEQMKRLRFDFAKTITDCVELIRPLAVERGVKISTELSPLEIEGDAERLAQAVTNLLSNAIQYNRDGGEVKISLKPENGMAVLVVSDTGQGIAAEDLPRVFERFYRADKSRSSGNAGLGLAISKAIIAGHGGTIDVASKENAGTTFIIRLPALV